MVKPIKQTGPKCKQIKEVPEVWAFKLRGDPQFHFVTLDF